MQQQQMDKLLTQIRSAKIETRKTDQLLPYARNARKHEDWQVAQIAASIKEFGFTNPILIDESGEIVAGHGRVMAALKLSLEEVPCIVLSHMTPIQRKAYVIADNQLALNSTWDVGILGNELDELKLDGFDIDLIGFGDDELNAILDGANSVEGTEGLTDPDEVPEVEKPIVSRGEVWVLGNHRLMCGDSTAITDVEKLMAGEKADMVFTDPPYNIASDSKNYAADKSKSMNDLKNAEWDKNFDIIPALSCMMTACASSVTIYVWTSHFLIQKIWDTLGPWADFTSYCVWSKPNPMPSLSKRHWTWNSELCVYATKGSKRTVNFPDEGHAPSVWSFTKKSDGTHPTQKPIELCEHGINFSSAKGAIILDLFLGSGSTLIACEKTGRRCFGMEIDPHYCTVILKRWAQFTGKEPQRLEEDGSLTQMSEIN